MKKAFILFAAILSLCSCSEKMPIGNEVDSVVYLLSSGEREFTVSKENYVYSFSACKGGYDDRSYSVEIVVDEEDVVRYTALKKESFRMIPRNSFELEPAAAVIGSGDDKAVFRVVFDPDCLTEGVDFILPLRIRCEEPDAVSPGRDVQYVLVKKINKDK